MDVHDTDGTERVLTDAEVESLVQDGLALVCPNDEDDEAAGWHAHIHTSWEEYDAISVLT
jgi:hypothetical protein